MDDDVAIAVDLGDARLATVEQVDRLTHHRERVGVAGRERLALVPQLDDARLEVSHVCCAIASLAGPQPRPPPKAVAYTLRTLPGAGAAHGVMDRLRRQ